MSAVLQAQEPSARYLDAAEPALVRQFNSLATAPGGVARIREVILALAVQGKLESQDLRNEPANVLRHSIAADDGQSTMKGRGRRAKPVADISEQEQWFALPPGWAWARLGSLGDWGAGATPSRSNSSYYGGSIPWFKSGELTADFISESEETITDAALADCSLRLNQVGDVLVAMYGATIGKTAILSVRGTTNQAVCACTPFAGLRNTYLLLLLKALKPYFVSIGAGGAQPNISREKIVATVVGLPPLEEQARIVARVDELMRLCDALEDQGRLEAEQHARLLGTLLGTLTDSSTPGELAANWQRVADHFDLLLDRPEAVDALEQTILQLAVRGLLVPQDAADVPAQELSVKIQHLRKSKRKITPPDSDAIAEAGIDLPIGWSWCSVDQVSTDDETAITDGPFGANLKTEHYIESEGFRVIRLQNIGAGVFRDEHRAYVDEDRYNRLIRHAAFPGDIVVAGLVDESIRCCIVPDGIGPAIVKADCYRFAVHERVSAQYICLYLCSDTAHQFASAHHHGLTLTRIGLGNFRSIPVPLPPAGEQRRIVARVSELRRLCADLRKRLGRERATQAALADALIDQALVA